MLPDLTPDQRAKLARGWVWRPGHAAIWTNSRGEALPVRYIRAIMGGARCQVMGEGGHTWQPVPRELTPRLEDDVTADGLLRTARTMWRDESLHVVPTDTGVALCVVRPRVNGERWRYVWDGETWVRPPAGRSLKAQFQSEQAAILAAILAAPEAP